MNALLTFIGHEFLVLMLCGYVDPLLTNLNLFAVATFYILYLENHCPQDIVVVW